ncbi:fatty acid desaturase family protein [Mycobacterium marinum]|uniref:fatty acid desaturase family protein n=1 Tax=Mycobacterium marinum TaxID=1781 RepID=UPI000358D71C|nr:fatty acid desaturase [Mycobacterium marinum]EPQ79408.1 PUTATIVE LINOLEOYL-CoA DESATURASE [Mycobacterium marinum str. Europe]
MAITQVAEFAHLSDADLEALGADLAAIRRDIEDERGEKDRAYILRTIAFQRLLDIAARITIAVSRSRFGWLLGVTALAAAKSIENMELGHNIGHGQWDWMNDPEIHSSTWEWDMAGVSSQWRYSHNYRHHVFTNVVGVDDDLGFGVLRVTRDQKWRPSHLYQPLRNVLLAIMFEWGIAAHGLHSEHERAATDAEKSAHTRALIRKMARQAGKDYLFFPTLSLRRWRRDLTGNIAANLLRNLWAYIVIACGHFPDGAEKFTPAALEGETKPEWYLRQMLGTANFRAGPVLAFLSGNLCYQIEHHLFPDLPSNRYAQIAQRVRVVCATYDLPYTTGPLARQYLLTFRTISKLALPDRFLIATCDDAPETASEIKFRHVTAPMVSGRSDSDARRRGLVSATRQGQVRQRSRHHARRDVAG